MKKLSTSGVGAAWGGNRAILHGAWTFATRFVVAVGVSAVLMAMLGAWLGEDMRPRSILEALA